MGIFNVTKATCGTTCPTCFGYTDFQVQSVTSTAPISANTTFKALALGQNGVWQDVSALGALWSSSNSSVATSQGSGTFKGVGGGTFQARANANLIDYPADCPEGPGHPCPTSPYFGQASGKVQVPTSLQALTQTVLSTGTSGDYGCIPTQNFGIKIAVTYQVRDQDAVAINNSSMEPQETITNQCINGSCSDPVLTYSDIGPSRISGTSKFTSSTGQFKDAPLGICGSAAFNASATQNIRVLLNGTPYGVRLNLFSFTGPSSGTGSISAVPDISKYRP